MRICDLPEDKIVVGMRVRSLVNPERLGTIVSREPTEEDKAAGQYPDMYSWIKWDGNDRAYGGFFFNDCECEVVE